VRAGEGRTDGRTGTIAHPVVDSRFEGDCGDLAAGTPASIPGFPVKL